MRKVILVMILTLMSGSAMSEWVPLGTSGKTITFYANPASIRKSGNKVKMWTLFDYITAQRTDLSVEHMSVMEQQEFDCKEEQMRQLYQTLHSGNMLEGRIVQTIDDPSKWRPVPPGTINESLLKFACRKQ